MPISNNQIFKKKKAALKAAFFIGGFVHLRK